VDGLLGAEVGWLLNVLPVFAAGAPKVKGVCEDVGVCPPKEKVPAVEGRGCSGSGIFCCCPNENPDDEDVCCPNPLKPLEVGLISCGLVSVLLPKGLLLGPPNVNGEGGSA
jgi:hypothetical protein